MKMKRYAIILISVLVMIGTDLATKAAAVAQLKGRPPFTVIDGILEFRYLENDGMAWGLFSGARWIFVLLTFVALFILIYAFIRIPRQRRYVPLLAVLTVLTAGAAGNMIDRIFLGYVRDFICVTFIDFPIFNVADIYATVSMIGLILLVIFLYKGENDFQFLNPKYKDGRE